MPPRRRNKKKTAFSAEREALRNRIIEHFNKHYGKDETKVESWKRLCTAIGVEEGSSVIECKEVVPLVKE